MPKLLRGPHVLNYELGSTGRPTLFLHGIGGGYGSTFADNNWEHETVAAGRRHIGLDLRGRGLSSPVDDASAIPFGCQVDDCVALLDELDVETTDVVGFSMGAGLALRLAVDHGDRVDRVVMLGCNGLALAAAGFVPGSVNQARVHLDDARRALAVTLGSSEPATAAYLDAQFDVWADTDFEPVPTGELGSATMLITGTKDDGPPGFSALEIASLVAESFEDAGHLLVPDVDHLGSVSHSHVRNAAFDHLEGQADD